MPVFIYSKDKTPSESDWDEVKKVFKLPVPLYLESFFNEYNGGLLSLKCDYFHVKDLYNDFIEEYGRDTGVYVNYFLSITENYDISNTINDLREYHGMAKEYFPVSTDSGGNYVLISLKGKYEGMVFFWDHEINQAYLIAKSWSEFIEGLTRHPDTTDEEIAEEEE
tara:strand:+ start:986 stop:1483 length:498 start_codon:yes stop_codon:yes gene_type:complete